MKPCIVMAGLAVAALTARAAEADAADNINNYLTDITGGAVAASGLVGLDKGVAQIETSQDLIVALQPLASRDSKSAFGFAITPARTTLAPMSGNTFVRSDIARLLGSLTLSYAQNSTRIANADYRKSAFSLGTVYYFNLEDDPVRIGNRAFTECLTPKMQEANANDVTAIVTNPALSADGKQVALAALTDKLDKSLLPCIDAALKGKARWNSSRASFGYGEGRVEDASGDSHTLGKSLSLNVQLAAGEQGVVAISVRRTRDALDPTSLGQASLVHKNSTLAAARYTYGDREGSSLRAMIEASNSKSASANAFKDAFVYAVGIDRKIVQGGWLELRVGRNRSVENGKDQTTALMNFNISPTLFAFKK